MFLFIRKTVGIAAVSREKAVSKRVNVMMRPPHAGRFDDSVIEERRQCSEDLLQFSANIPALYSSQHIQEFFKVRNTGTRRNPRKLD